MAVLNTKMPDLSTIDSVFQSAKKTYGVPINAAQIPESKSLVTFDGTKLKLIEELKLAPTVKVVSILGKARMGKSTFLNAFVSKFTKVNSQVFTTADGIEHCTYGIDYCYIPEQNLLLLDSQGLANGDARHDPALLLFIYLVSDVVIFNDSKILQNEALKLIEPICTFTQYLDFDNFVKPVLMFRLSDGKLVKDVQKNLANVMAHHEDQYNSIRESIENVFQEPVRIVKTETLKDGDERCLNGGDYLGLIGNAENGFDAAINAIMDVVKGAEPRACILSDLPGIIEKINGNEQIKIEKLDVVALIHEKAIRDWLDTVPAEAKSEMPVDGTQSSFETLVVPRKALVTKIKTDFTKRFKAISDNIKKKFKAELDGWLDGPVKRAIALSEEKARAHAKAAGYAALEADSQLTKVKDVYLSMAEADATLIDRHLGAYQRFQAACGALYKPIKDIYDSWLGGIKSEMATACKQARDGAQAQKTVVSEHIESVLAGFDDWCLQEIEKLDMPCCQLKNSAIVEEWRQRVTLDLQTFIKKTVKRQDVQLSIKNTMLDALWYEDTTEVGMDYPLIAELYKGFVAAIGVKPMSCVTDALVEKKEVLLVGHLFLNPLEGKQYYTNNPEIMFVFDSVLLNTVINDKNGAILKANMPYMTQRTWDEKYRPMYVEVMEGLADEGLYTSNGDLDEEFEYLISENKDKNITTYQYELDMVKGSMYNYNLTEFFIIALKKLYCKNFVKERVVPVSSEEKKESVFSRPNKITDEMCAFLGKPAGTLVSRSDVTRGVFDYVKKHGLNNKHAISPDAALRKLLRVTVDENLSLFNLQRYLKIHYA